MPQAIADWTVARVLELPDDGNRYEVVDGELLVSPAPSLLHRRAVLALHRRIDPFVEAHRLGCTLHAPADIEFDDRTLVQPVCSWRHGSKAGALASGRRFAEILTERMEWRPAGGVPALEIDLAALFAEGPDE